MGFGRKIRRKQKDPRVSFTRKGIQEGILQLSQETTRLLKKGEPLSTIVDGGRRRLTLLVGEAERLDPPACSKGCSWCCRGMKVSASPWELLTLVRWLRSNRDEASLASLRVALQQHADLTYSMNAAARVASKIPCPFLDLANDSCTVHPARPWACMAHLVSDVSTCKDSHGDPEGGVAKNLYGALSLGLVHTGFLEAADQLKLSHQEVELTQGLTVALATPDAEMRWLAGEDVFASARRPADDEDDLNAEDGVEASSLSGVLDAEV